MNRPPQPQPTNQLKLELGEKEAEGIYANIALITHSPSEFVIDFARWLPGQPKTRVQTRVVMAPRNLKRFLKALDENIKRYEERHGEIPEDTGQDPPSQNIGFTTR